MTHQNPMAALHRLPKLPWLLIGMLVSALVLRAWCATGQMWLDEIWSLRFAGECASPVDILSIRHDNNHLLNTLWMWCMGNEAGSFSHRLLSVVSGAAALGMLPLATIGRKPAEAVFAVFLCAFSYPMILYASEARGYAPAVAAALAAYLFHSKYENRGRKIDLLMFWLFTAVGMLAHITSIYVFAALVVRSLVTLFHEKADIRVSIGRLSAIYIAPTLFLAGYYLFFIKGLFIAGGPETNFFETIRYALVLASGLPDHPASTLPAVAMVLAAVTAGLVYVNRDNDSRWVFYIWVLFLAPFAVLVIKPPHYLHFRYFLICLPFLFILGAHVLYRLYNHSMYGKALVCAVLVLFCSGNALRIQSLISIGRGDYRSVVSYIAEHTSGSHVSVGSDHDLASGMVLAYYSRYLPADKQIVYHKIKEWPPDGPEWILLQSQEKKYTPKKQVTDMRKRTYSLHRTYAFEGQSGWHWSIYRNDIFPPTPGSPPESR